MKTLLVTGGCGFIGSNFIKGFLESHPDWHIINLDKLSYSGNRENTRPLENDSRYRFIHDDICNPSAVDEAVKSADAVIHFAAETHVDRSIESATDFLQTNVIGTQIMLDKAMRHGIKRYLHISTDEVYGSVDDGHVDETATLKPNSPYAASKAAGDLLVRAYQKTYGFGARIVRSANNFGPYQFPEKVIPLFITNLLEDKKIPLYGTGANRRDWIYVEDNCRAIELIFDRGEDGEIYNIAAGNEKTNRELTEAILQSMGKGTESIQFVTDRLGHDFRYGIDASKIRKLGFEPRWTFEEALENTIAWYRKNTGWWNPLKKDKFTLK